MTSTIAPPAVVQRLRAAALAALVALIGLALAWELWLAPTGSGTLALKAVPLALCVDGLARHRMIIYRWLSLLLWLYVMEGVVRASTEGGRAQALALTELGLSLLLFILCTLYIRRRLRAAAPAGT